MILHRGKVRLAARAGVAVLMVSISACGTRTADSPPGVGGVGAEKLGFERHADSVQWPGTKDEDYVAPGEGLQLLARQGNCVLGIGTYANGYEYVPVNWSGNADCTKLALHPDPAGSSKDESGVPNSMRHGVPGGGIPAQAVVEWGDGSQFFASSVVRVRERDGRVRQLADLKLPWALKESDTSDRGTVSSAVRSGNRLLIGGSETVSGATGPFLYASDDRGATVHRVTLPAETVSGSRSPVGPMAADGPEVIAVGSYSSNAFTQEATGTLVIWHSSDSGGHWAKTIVNGMPTGTRMHAAFRAAGRWFAVGDISGAPTKPNVPVLLTSPDGVAWTKADTTAMGAGGVVSATVDAQGHPVMVGSLRVPGKLPQNPAKYCGAVWTGDGTPSGWQRGELGCHSQPPAAVTTLANGTVVIAGNSDLWLRR
ncbi:hypothetical protein [Streptomyces sp. NPDC056670]|uniref:hypothetical protein n=1 Tax=Streptomyces sp. NPDC056670 TaxID=3345904 RepID=UPI0036BAED60